MKFTDLENGLEAAGLRVFKDAAPSGETDYIVATIYALPGRQGDDSAALRWRRCQLDCYSQSANADEEGGVFEFILNTLDDLGIPFGVRDVGMDPDAAALRMIIQCDLT